MVVCQEILYLKVLSQLEKIDPAKYFYSQYGISIDVLGSFNTKWWV